VGNIDFDDEQRPLSPETFDEKEKEKSRKKPKLELKHFL
jgi:hypothetical protein